MCRFAFYVGPRITLASLVTEPDHSIINQSHRAQERAEPLNGDGFGVAWHDDRLIERFVTFKEVSPAWSSRNLRSLAPAISSDCFLAHVRAATAGAVAQANCHPFARDGYAFMHNGGIGRWRAIRRELLRSLSDKAFDAIEGSTDSELIFAKMMDQLESGADIETMSTVMLNTIQTIEEVVHAQPGSEHSALNLVLTDGQSSVISRYASPGDHRAESLYYWHGERYACVDGVCSMTPGSNDALLVSSEPLSRDSGWTAVPHNHIALIKRGQAPEFRPIQIEL